MNKCVKPKKKKKKKKKSQCSRSLICVKGRLIVEILNSGEGETSNGGAISEDTRQT